MNPRSRSSAKDLIADCPAQLHFEGGKPLVDAIVQALQIGFRGINTSQEMAEEVEEGIRRWGGKREDVYIGINCEYIISRLTLDSVIGG